MSQSLIREIKNAFTEKKGSLLSSRIENRKNNVRERSIHTTKGFLALAFEFVGLFLICLIEFQRARLLKRGLSRLKVNFGCTVRYL